MVLSASSSPDLAAAIAGRVAIESRPRSRHAHWFASAHGAHLLAADGSLLYEADLADLSALDAAAATGDDAVERTLAELGVRQARAIDETPLAPAPPRALSLAVAQSCNLACGYCYASQGGFGAPARQMSHSIARKAVDMLFQDVGPGDRVNIAFLGGEPLLNRAVVRDATEYAHSRAAETGAKVGFSLTTNGTLLQPSDAVFFEQHGFALTISVDGLREDQDRQRPFKSGHGSFDRIMARAEPLLKIQRAMQVSIRATITPANLRLKPMLDFFLEHGFHSAGFSPVLHSPTGRGELENESLMAFLAALIECGLEFERKTLSGERYAFANMTNALTEIHRGAHRPYPCGAGAGYLGVSADGALSPCHRLVGDATTRFGDLNSGVDAATQERWLLERHVLRQEPCSKCWARYMCGGGVITHPLAIGANV